MQPYNPVYVQLIACLKPEIHVPKVHDCESFFFLNLGGVSCKIFQSIKGVHPGEVGVLTPEK